MEVNLIRYTPNPLEAITTAAAITHGTTYGQIIAGLDGWPRDKMENLVKHVYEAGHWSVFEFADFDFEVTGASRVFETQAVRSRMASYEWESGRRDQKYVLADELLKRGRMDYLKITALDGIDCYEHAVQHEHIAPELARYELPQGVARMGRIKRNFRNLMETAETRLCTHAQAEYREFMQKCKDLVTEVDPFLGSLLVPKCQVLGYCNEGETCRFNGVRTKKEVMQVLTLLDQFGGEGVKKHC